MEVLTKVQRQLDLFVRCNVTYNEEKEVKPNMVAVLEQFESILVAIVTHMHKNTNGKFLPSILRNAAEWNRDHRCCRVGSFTA